MTQEALKLAEDYAHMRAIWYVESLYGTSASHTELREKVMLGAHQALKEALAQPEQEPVANYCKECLTYNGHHEGCSHYTTPPQRTWQGLTNEDISEVVRGTHNTGSFVRAIEAKLREKNSQHKEKNT